MAVSGRPLIRQASDIHGCAFHVAKHNCCASKEYAASFMSASQETEAPGQPSDKHLPAWSSYAPPPLQVTTSADFTLRNLSNRDFSPVNSLSPGLAINTVSPAPVSHRLTTSISSPYLTIPPYLPLSPKSAAFSPSFVARSHTSEDLSRPTWLAKQPSLLSISEVPSPSQPAESPADLDTPSQGQFSLPSIGHAHRTEDHTGQFRRSLTEESRSDQHRQTFPTDDVLVRPLATDGSRRAFDLDIDFSEVPMEGLRDEAVEGLRTQHVRGSARGNSLPLSYFLPELRTHPVHLPWHGQHLGRFYKLPLLHPFPLSGTDSLLFSVCGSNAARFRTSWSQFASGFTRRLVSAHMSSMR